MKKSIILLFATALLNIAPFAQAKAPVKELNLTVTVDEYKYVQELLQERPFKESANLVIKLDQQVQRQLQPDSTKR